MWIICYWYSISGLEYFFGHFVSSPFPCAQSTRSAARAAYSHIQFMTSYCPNTAASGKITALFSLHGNRFVQKPINAFNRAQHWAFWVEIKHAKCLNARIVVWIGKTNNNHISVYLLSYAHMHALFYHAHMPYFQSISYNAG